MCLRCALIKSLMLLLLCCSCVTKPEKENAKQLSRPQPASLPVLDVTSYTQCQAKFKNARAFFVPVVPVAASSGPRAELRLRLALSQPVADAP